MGSNHCDRVAWQTAGPMPSIAQSNDSCRTSPAADRNKSVILEALQRLLPVSGRLLEIASGTGQHAAHCAAGLPGWTWQPSDPDPSALSSIAAWAAQQPSPGLQTPLMLDVLAEPWSLAPGRSFDAVFCANMLHIAPWATCSGLMRGAARHLAVDGSLLTYGPYLEQGAPTAPGNLEFDRSLRTRNPAWGIRALEDVVREARAAGLQLHARIPMPANNLLLVFKRPANTGSAGTQT